MWKFAGSAAGATLGFIHNNIPGAIKYGRLGHRAGRWRASKSKHPNRMAKTPVFRASSNNARKRRAQSKLPYRVVKKRRTRAPTKKGRGTASYKHYSPRAIAYRKSNTSRRRNSKGSYKKDPHAVAASFSNSRYGPGPRLYSGFSRRGVKNTFTSTTGTRIECATNEQKCAYLNTWQVGGSTSNVSLATGAGYGVIASLLKYMKTQLFGQLPRIQNITADSGVMPGWKTQKYVMERLVMKHEMRNMTNAVLHVTVYDVALRPNIVINDIDMPLDAWKEGLDDQSVAGQTVNYNLTSHLQIPGSTPFRSKKFCKEWRVYGTKRLVIHPGHTHIHTVTVRPRNAWAIEEDDIPGTGGNWMLPGVTTATFVAVHGGICNSQATASKVGYTNGALDSICRTYGQFRLIEKSGRVDSNYFTLQPIADPLMQPEDDGAAPTSVKTA